jgi:D-alanine--poly(phosphoribitol) ligase subunit 1
MRLGRKLINPVPVSAIQPSAQETDQQKIDRFNQTAHPFPDTVTLHELFETQVARTPDATAIICEHDKTFGTPTLTFAELNARANQLAHKLRAAGVGPETIVGLVVERSFSMIIGLLGILKAGGAYLPIAPDNPPDRIRYLLADANVRILLTQQKTAQLVPFDGQTINLEDPTTYEGSTENPNNLSRPENLAYVIYTSGSTGRPKGVMIEHRSVVNRLHWMQSAYPIAPGDVILQKTPYYFDVSVWELFWWSMTGATLAFLRPGGEKIPMLLIDAIKRHRVTTMHFVPSMLNAFLEYLDGRDANTFAGLSSLRHVFASGEALMPAHVRKFNQLLVAHTPAHLINLYGPTEATVDVTYFDCPTDNDFERIPIGRPVHNTRLHILKDGQSAPIGETGELCLAGVQVARGYLNNPALTAEKFTDHPANPGERIYRTGDIARWLPDGNVEYLGREDHQVKIRGLRIELGEIENTIREFPGVSDCVVVVKRYSESVILIVAYLVERTAVDTSDLKDHLKQRLPDYMVPSHFERIDTIPLTPTGKADRKALPEPQIIKK